MNGKYLDKKQIMVIADSLVGMKFKELNENIDEANKGAQGLTIESDAFGIVANSRKEADFVLAGLELKTTPVKKNKNGTISAKERLVLNIINFLLENTENFYESSFWKKNELMLILFYLFEDDKNKGEMKIIKSYLNEFNSQDLNIIKNDWQIIASKIKSGKAHEISEADTLYLGACSKGVNKNSLRRQPNSEIMAMQRAYSLKTTYMTQLVRKIIGNSQDLESILKSDENSNILEYIEEKVSKYYGMSQQGLCRKFNIISDAKNLNEMIISRILNLSGKISKSEEFQKANIKLKTIRVEQNGRIKESMSFPYFKYEEIVKELWEDSKLRNLFETTKFMFVVFLNNGTEYVLNKVVFWNMPERDIDIELKKVWQKTVDVIKSGEIVKEIKNNKWFTNFPGMKENIIAHVRPHGRNKRDVCKLPVKDKLTGVDNYEKHCFWLNSNYIKKIIGKC